MLRFWAEFLKPEELISEKAIYLLTKYKAQILIALRPNEYKKWEKSFKIAYDKGVNIGIWPLLPDEKGYWINERNVDDFRKLIVTILKWAEKNGFSFGWIAADVELPYFQGEYIKKVGLFSKLNAFRAIARENVDRYRFLNATQKLNALVEWLHERNIKVIAPATQILLDVSDPWFIEDLMETPIMGVDWDLISFMNYVSMEAGYIPILTERAARYALYLRALKAHKLLGRKAGFSVGVTYIGKLGDEPFYTNPDQLAADVSACRAAGIEDIAIFNFEGIVRRKNGEEWVKKVISARPRVPPFSIGAYFYVNGIRILSSVLKGMIWNDEWE